MTTNNDESLNSGTEAPKRARGLQTSVRTLLALVACCAAVLWSWRNVTVNSDPVLVEARSIQKRAIGALRSDKPADRLTAIVELERLRTGDSSVAILPLVQALDDPVMQVRIAAAEALFSIGPSVVRSGSGGETIHAAAQALIQCLDDPDSAFRVTAINTLASIGSSAVKAGSEKETTRAAATAFLRCLKDPEPGVRSAAAIALGEVTPPSAASVAKAPIDRTIVMNALVELLGDRDALVRRAAINAMTAHPAGSDPPQALAEGMKDESPANRKAAISGLTGYRQGLDPWAPVLLSLAENDPDPSVREHCYTILYFAFKPPAVTPAVVPALSAGLLSNDPKVRCRAASLLREFGADASAAIPKLLGVLNEPLDPHVVPVMGPDGTFDPGCAAAFALRRIAPGTPAASVVIAALMEVARSGPVSRRGWAAIALADFGPTAIPAVPVLITVLKDASPDDTFERAASAAVALGKIAPESPSEERVIAALVPVLQSKAWLARAKAIEALAQFGPRAAAALPGIRALKDDRDADVRDAVKKALAAIGTGSPP